MVASFKATVEDKGSRFSALGNSPKVGTLSSDSKVSCTAPEAALKLNEGSPWQWNRDGCSAYRGISGPLLGPTHRRIMGAVRSLSGAQRPEGWSYPETLYLCLDPISLHSTPQSQLGRWSPTPWSSASAGFSFNILLGREDSFTLGQKCLFPQ